MVMASPTFCLEYSFNKYIYWRCPKLIGANKALFLKILKSTFKKSHVAGSKAAPCNLHRNENTAAGSPSRSGCEGHDII